MKLRSCNAIRCQKSTPPERPFCEKCLPMIQTDTRRILAKHFRAGRLFQPAIVRDMLQRAQQEILYFITNGTKVPRDGGFEFDDQGETL